MGRAVIKLVNGRICIRINGRGRSCEPPLFSAHFSYHRASKQKKVGPKLFWGQNKIKTGISVLGCPRAISRKSLGISDVSIFHGWVDIHSQATLFPDVISIVSSVVHCLPSAWHEHISNLNSAQGPSCLEAQRTVIQRIYEVPYSEDKFYPFDDYRSLNKSPVSRVFRWATLALTGKHDDFVILPEGRDENILFTQSAFKLKYGKCGGAIIGIEKKKSVRHYNHGFASFSPPDSELTYIHPSRNGIVSGGQLFAG